MKYELSGNFLVHNIFEKGTLQLTTKQKKFPNEKKHLGHAS